jgi:DNA polymerase I
MSIDPITVDFETEAIVGNPIVNPPKPVGVAVWVPGHEPVYMSWGHPEFEGDKNNCTWWDALDYLTKLRDSGRPILFHNAGFDLSVWNQYFKNAEWPFWLSEQKMRVHDTLYLLFLADPYAPTYSLKPSADRYLGMAATEQHNLRDWILQNVVASTEKNWGAFIALAPPGLVGRYAVGDVVRTRGLFDLLHAQAVEKGMEAAYDRERRVFPGLFHGCRRGIRIDRDLLDHHTGVYTTCLELAQDQCAGLLGSTRDVFSSDSLLCDALERSKAVAEWVITKTGKRSMAKDNLKITNPQIKMYMDYISGLETCLQTFMRPWLGFSANDGRLHPNWNQVRQERNASSNKGTRTGRLSSDSPNFQNVPTEFSDALGQPLPTPEGLHPLPMLRRYCLPEHGHVWLKRDYSSQEIRLLAHFEDGRLCAAYRLTPGYDPHEDARQIINTMIGILYARKDVKITAFSIIYGSGATGLSIQLGRSYDEAWRIKEAYLDAMPGVRALMQDVSNRGKSGGYIRTWGGRIYYPEPPKEVDGRMRDFSYKLLNYLIQGSAADQTKESLADWDESRSWEAIFLATVHDEINISAPAGDWRPHMEHLQLMMNKDRLDVPVLSEGFMGQNWQDIEEVA